MENSETSHSPSAQSATIALQFNGNSRDYFRIWIVNLCLTLCTLGIFSAWAKVRKKRYFYSHTTLDNTPFQYLGQPLLILKGRLVAVLLFLVYYLTSNIFTTLLPYVIVAGILLGPWVIIRSAAFNARYSAFRNITFRYDATYRDAVLEVYWLGIIPLIAIGTIFDWWGNYMLAAGLYALFGLLLPWWLIRLKRLVVNHTSYGGQSGVLSAEGNEMFKIYFKGGLIMGGLGFVASLMLIPMLGLFHKNPAIAYVATLPVYAAYVLGFAYIQAHNSNLIWNHIDVGSAKFRSTLRGRDLAKLYLTNALGIIFSLGLLTPWAVVRTYQYRIDHLDTLVSKEKFTDYRGDTASNVQAAGAEVGEFFDLDLSL